MSVVFVLEVAADTYKLVGAWPRGREGLMGCGNPLLGLFTYDKGDIRHPVCEVVSICTFSRQSCTVSCQY